MCMCLDIIALPSSPQIKLVNIHNHEILDGKANIILGLLWTLILHFQVSVLLHICTPTHMLLYILIVQHPYPPTHLCSRMMP